MRELLEFVGFCLVLFLIGAVIVIAIVAGLHWYSSEQFPESGTILAQNPNKYGHCTIGYEMPSGERRHADMYIQDCVSAQVGLFCSFGVTRSRIAYNPVCEPH